MRNIELSKYAKDMMHERNILEKWVWRTIGTSDRVKIGDDNNTHYIKAISEHGGTFPASNRQPPRCTQTISHTLL